MKLQDIQEARYHAQHPIIDWMQQAFTRENSVHGIYKPLTKEEYDELYNILPDYLGDPFDEDGENLSWRSDNEHGAFYIDLQNQGGAAIDYNRYLITVSKIK